MPKIEEVLISKIDLSNYVRVVPDKPINADRPVVPCPVVRIPVAKLPTSEPVTETENRNGR